MRAKAPQLELLIGSAAYPATVLDVSPEGVYVRTEAPAWVGALVRARFDGSERFAIVAHARKIPRSLAALAQPGMGLRWVDAQPVEA